MKIHQMLAELSEAAAQVGLPVRYERGRFRGGRCVVNGEEQVVLNRRQPPEAQFAVLARALRGAPTEAVYLRPAVRRAMEEVWARAGQVGDEAEVGVADDD